MKTLEHKIPEDATHKRDDWEFYKIKNGLVYFHEYREWHLCEDPSDLKGWLEELEEIKR